MGFGIPNKSFGASDPFTSFATGGSGGIGSSVGGLAGSALGPVGGIVGSALGGVLDGGGGPDGPNISRATSAPVYVPVTVNVAGNSLNKTVKNIVIAGLSIAGGVALARVLK